MKQKHAHVAASLGVAPAAVYQTAAGLKENDMVKITVPQTVWHNITLTEDQVENISREYLKTLIRPGEFLKQEEEKTMLAWIDEDRYGSHSSFTEKIVREATPLDKAVFEVLNHLNVTQQKRQNNTGVKEE